MAEDLTPDAIAQALETSPVFRAPGTEQWLSDADAAALEELIVTADLDLYVVLVPPPPDGGIRAGEDLLTRVKQARDEAELDSGGLYLGIDSARPWTEGEAPTGPYAGSTQFDTAERQWGPVSEATALEYGADDLSFDVGLFLEYGHDGGDGTPFELGEGLIELTGHLAAADLDTVDAAGSTGLGIAVDTPSQSTGVDGGGGAPGGVDGVALPVVSGLLALAVLAAAVGVARRRRSRRLPAAGRRTFALPDSVLSRVREAEADQLRRRARAAVLALGEHIDATALGPRDDLSTWQAALDHYEVAGRLVPDDGPDPDVLDAVGAIVLADRGEQALAATRRRRRGVTYATPCFLNPLHGAGTRGESLTHGSFRVDAPVCSRCRKDLGAGRRPDILDVVVDGRPEHYFETGREPWASTGFGALEPDLLTRLRSRR